MFPLYPLFWEFLLYIDDEFCQNVFCIYWDDHIIFILQFVVKHWLLSLYNNGNPGGLPGGKDWVSDKGWVGVGRTGKKKTCEDGYVGEYSKEKS